MDGGGGARPPPANEGSKSPGLHRATSSLSVGGDGAKLGSRFRTLESNETTELLQNLTPFFHCMEALESLWPSRVIYLGALARFLQPLAFVVNRHWQWGWFMGKMSDAVYFFVLPFWDPAFAHDWALVGGLIAYWTVVAVVIGTFANMAFQIREGYEYVQKSRSIAICRVMLHGFTSIGLVPATGFLLQLMVCDHRAGTLWLHRDTSCWGTLHSVHVGVGLVVLLVLLVLALLSRCMLYKHAPFSSHMWARAHSRLDGLTVAHDMAVPLLYFTLLGNGFERLFAVTLCLLSACMAVAFAFVKPYYKASSTVLVVWSHALTMVIAAYVCKPWEEMASRDVDTVFVVAAVFVTWMLALLGVKMWRVTRNYTSVLNALRERNMSNMAGLKHTITPAPVPYRLPWEDLRFSPYAEIVPSASGASEETPDHTDDFEEALSNYASHYMISVSHIGSIYVETDIELSTRYLRDFSIEFGQVPEVPKLGYYSRLFTKGLAKFPNSHMVELHLVFFLQFYCRDSVRALQYLNALFQENVSMPVLYTMVRLNSRLKGVLNIKDNTHHKGLLKAHKLHVQALGYLTLFWSKLLSKSFDSLDLALLADTITEKREEGLQAYETAIATRADKLVANRYAYFLEQVMLEEANAAAVRASIRDDAQGADSKVSSAADLSRRLVRNNAQNAQNQKKSKKIAGLHFKMNLMFLGFFLIVVGFAALYIHIGTLKTTFLDVIHSAGELRTLALYNGYLTLRITNAAREERGSQGACAKMICSATGLITADAEGCATTTVFTKTGALRDKLRTNLDLFRDRFQELTHGKYMMTYEPLIDLFKQPLTQMTTFFTADKSETKLAGLFVICTKILNSLEGVIDSELPCLASGVAQSFLRENTEDFAAVFNTSLELYEDEFEETLRLSLILTGVFVGVSFCLVFLVYLMLELSFLTIATEKMETLNLFSLIPHNTLERIHADSKEKLAKYETLEDEERLEDKDDDTDMGDLGETDEVTGAFKVFLRNQSKADGKALQSSMHKDETSQQNDEMQEVQEMQVLDTEEDEELMNQYTSAPKGDHRWVVNTVLFAAFAASVPLTFLAARDIWAMKDAAASNKVGAKYELELSHWMWDTTTAAAAFITTCKPHYEARRRLNLVNDPPSEKLSRLRALDPSSPYRYFDIEATLQAMREAEAVGLAEVGPTCGVLERYESVHQTERNPYAFHDANSTKDPILVAKEALGKVLTGEYYSSVDAVSDVLSPKGGQFSAPDSSTIATYLILLIVLYAVLSAMLSVVDPTIGSDDEEPDKKKELNRVAVPFRVGSFLALVAFLLSITVYVEIDEYTDLLRTRDQGLQHAFDAREALERPRMALVEYLLLGGQNFLHRYESLSDEDGAVAQRLPYDQLLRLAFNEFTDMTDAAAAKNREVVVERQRSFEKHTMLVNHFEYAALNLATSALGHGESDVLVDIYGSWTVDNAPTPDELKQAGIDFRAMESAVNGSIDLAGGYGLQILFSNEYVAAQQGRTNDLAVLRDLALTSMNERIKAAEDRLGELLPAMLVLYALAVGVMLLNAVLVLVRYRIAQTKALRGVAKKNQRDPEVLFRQNINRVRASLLLFIALVVVVLIVELVYRSRVQEIAPMLNYASARPWLSSRNVFAAQLYRETPAGMQEVDWEVSEAGHALMSAIDDSRAGDNRLHYEYTRGAGGAISDPIFGPSDPTDSRTQCAPQGSMEFNDMGIDIESRIFVAKLLQYRYQRTAASEAELAAAVPKLLEGLQESTKAFQSEAKDQLTLQTFTIIGILLCASLLLAIECVFIFRPMSTKLFQQEEGTKLMVQMIPEKERNTVGAIAQFLETGQVSSLKKLAVVNKLITETSTIPTVVCDNRGTIMMFSRAAESVFGWSQKEVLNKNVKMIMPPEFAAHHDLYLARFRKTGLKRIIGSSRNVRAQKKDGTIFPACVAVKDFRQCKKSVFIGFITDTSLDIEQERVNQLNVVISKSGFSPTICCDTYGKVIRWNRASTNVFGYTQKEALGKNVSFLMREELADKHDGYLDRFRRSGHTGPYVGTGKKLNQSGVRKNRQPFNVELFLEKLKLGSDKVILIANLRDVTQDMILEQRSLVHEHLTRYSPTPLLMISTTGVIQQWNPGAEREFGYLAKEVIGKNVTIIQPDEVAEKHDGYLSSYLSTGIKRVLGSTRVVWAKKKDKSLVHIALDVREIAPKNTQFQRLYIGFATNLAEQNRRDDVRNVYETVINLNPLPTVVINEKAIITSYSKVASEITKFSVDDAVGSNVKMLMPPSVAAEHDSYLETYFRTGVAKVINSTNIKVQCRKADDTYYPASLCIREVRTNREVRFIGYFHDESEKEAAKLQSTIGNFVVDLCPAPLICINGTGQIKLFSPMACKTFGWESDVIKYKNVKSLMTEEVAQAHDGYLLNYRENGKQALSKQSRTVHVTAMRSDETTFPATLCVTEFLHDDVSFFVGYVVDQTEVLAQQTVQKASEAVMNGSLNSIIAINHVGTIEITSPSAPKLFGYTAEEVNGKNVNMLMNDKDSALHHGYLKKYSKTGIKNIIGGTKRLLGKKKDGTEFYCDISIREVVVKSVLEGVCRGVFVGYMFDTSAEYLAEQQAKLNAMTHELVVYPLISINLVGKIISVNGPAEEMFGVKEEQVKGSNIKMLMPEQIAEQHDGYLQRYRKTRIKHVIDSSRLVKAKNFEKGTLMPIELFVREVINKNGDTVYYGNAKDLTKQMEIDSQRSIIESIIQLADYPIINITDIGTVKMYNKAARKMFGYREEEVVGNNIKMLQPEEIASVHDGYLSTYMKTRVAHVVGSFRNVPMKHKDGTTRDIKLWVDEIKNGEETSFVGYAKDLTEENEIMRRELISEQLQDCFIMPTFRIDIFGQILGVSKTACVTFGYTKEEFLNQNIKMIQTEEIRKNHDEYLRKYITSGVKNVIDTTRAVVGVARNPDGTFSELNVEVSVKEVKFGAGKRQYIGYLRTLEAENHAKRTVGMLKQILNLTPEPLIEMTTEGIVTVFNIAASNLFEYQPDEVIGQNIKMLQQPEVADNHDEYLQRYKETGKANVIGRFQLLKAKAKSGKTLEVFLRVEEVQVGGMEKIYIGLARDASADLDIQKADSVSQITVGAFPAPCVIMNQQGIIEVTSKSFCDVYEIPEPVGVNVKTIMPPEIADNHDGYLKRYIETGVKTVMDKLTKLKSISASGKIVNVESWIKEIEVSGVKKYVGYLRDLRPMKKAESDRELMAKLEQLSPVAIIAITDHGTILKANKRAAIMTGLAEAELIDINIKDIMPEPYRSEHDGYLRNYRETGIQKVIGQGPRAAAVQHRDGSVTPIEIVVFKVELKARPPVYVGSLSETTNLKQLQFSDGLNNGLQDLCNEALISIDEVGSIIRFNGQAEQLFEYTFAEVHNQNIKMLMPPEIAKDHDGYLASYVKTRVKHILDTERKIEGLSKGGQLLKLKIRAEEINLGKAGSAYVGFIEKA
eukprot:TRINITY_DN10770_c0_g2_i1.p1 TRINITY_DN10770_c0_g2~~TRINITY_DN10770_c0_g2_i1.p1  ORF type:complete len:3502 (+),score=1192.21 TRINITY_DN10770_c0_g2_i1:103-10506(+)